MFWKSKGVARALGIVFLVLGNLADTIPAISPYKPLLDLIGGALGVSGVVNAAGAALK